MHRNNVIDKWEFDNAMESMNVTDVKDMSHHWIRMDDNRDGVITLGEFDNEHK